MKLTRQKLIQLIHIAKQQLRMDELSYRIMLHELTGKNSCSKMTVLELNDVLNEMEKKGFNNTAKGYSPRTETAKVKSRIANKIRAIWIEMHKAGIIKDGSEKALNRFITGIVNEVRQKQKPDPKIKHLAFVHRIDNQMATIVLERLKQWQKRAKKPIT